MKRIKLAAILALSLTLGTINTYACPGIPGDRAATGAAVRKGYNLERVQPSTWKQFLSVFLAYYRIWI